MEAKISLLRSQFSRHFVTTTTSCQDSVKTNYVEGHPLSAVHDEVFLKLTALFKGDQRTLPVTSCDAGGNTGVILIWLLRICAGCCEYDNEHSAFIKARIYQAADRTAACNTCCATLSHRVTWLVFEPRREHRPTRLKFLLLPSILQVNAWTVS